MSQSSKSTQDFVPLREVRDGVLVLADGSLRALVMVSSINFALKSEDNQAAIIAQFQDLLNSLDFSIQVFVESRKMDIRGYIALLEERYAVQQSELMKIQTREYIEFIKTFTANVNIMTKTFFVVVPYGTTLASAGKNPLVAAAGAVQGLVNKKSEQEIKRETDANFEQNKLQLEQRLAVVDQGLVRCGLRAVRLGSEEIVELFYKLFNPGELDKPIPLQ